MAELLSMRKYAERRGVSVEAVSKAVKTGRCPTVPDPKDPTGKRRLIEPVAADREWDLATDSAKQRAPVIPEKIPAPPSGAPAQAAAAASVTVNFQPGLDPEGEAAGTTGSRLARARADKEEYAALAAQLDYEEKLGKLISADEAEKQWVDIATTVKTKALAIPTKARQNMPHLTNEDVATLERIVREVLEELARD